MFMSALLALGLSLQEKPKEDVDTLHRKVAELERKHGEAERRIQEALDKGDGAAAVQAREEQKKLEVELAEARDAVQRRGGLAWGVDALVTHWDNDLNLADRVGWSAYVSGIPGLFFEYARWETEDEDGSEEALIQAYRLGVQVVADPGAPFTLGAMLSGGLVRFTSEVPGTDGDTGLTATLHPQAVWTLRPGLRFSAGLEIDIVRTDFKQNHTHTNHNLAGSFGLDVRW